MRCYEASQEIAATAEDVWAVLTDPGRLQAADTGVVRIEGDVREGERIRVWSEVAPDRAFPVRVTRLERPRVMEWTGGAPLGLFTGVRRFTLSPAGPHTRLDVREEFTGPLLPLVWRTMPDLTDSFERFVRGVARAAEAVVR
ncbi:MAG: SRPBCC family protein [Nocardioides sp.]